MEDNEEFEFDKFMQSILSEEAKKQARSEDELEDTPARVYNKRYRELPQNRIVYRRPTK
jgi:hypothetical protein